MNVGVLIDYLRNNELSEVELYRVYEKFLSIAKADGFERGCDFLRGILDRQRSNRQRAIDSEFKLILEDIEDFINEEETNN